MPIVTVGGIKEEEVYKRVYPDRKQSRIPEANTGTVKSLPAAHAGKYSRNKVKSCKSC